MHMMQFKRRYFPALIASALRPPALARFAVCAYRAVVCFFERARLNLATLALRIEQGHAANLLAVA